MPYITNTRSVFGRLEDNQRHPFPDPLEDNDDDVTPTPSPATARRRLPLLQRPPVSSITTTTRSTVHGISTKGTDVRGGNSLNRTDVRGGVRGGNSLNNEMRRAQVFQHLQKERGDFVSTTPPTRRRLDDELE